MPVKIRLLTPTWITLLFIYWTIVIVSIFHLLITFSSLSNERIISQCAFSFESRWCHQIQSRSYSIQGQQLPICARCLGIYTGGALSFIVFKFSLSKNIYCNAFLLFMGLVDILLKTLWVDSSNMWRLIAGICLVIAITNIIQRIIEFVRPVIIVCDRESSTSSDIIV